MRKPEVENLVTVSLEVVRAFFSPYLLEPGHKEEISF
jgi:hypothetical protein